MKRIFTHIMALMAAMPMLAQGWPSNYGGVMLQAFYWNGFEDTQWAVLEQQADDLAASFDLIWIPQSGNCGGQSMGYDDLYWFPGGGHYDSAFGTEAQLRSMIGTFKKKGMGTIADVVINHRRNVSSWVDFPRETYNGVTYELLSTDICGNDDGGNTKKNAGGAPLGNNDTGEDWSGMRDLDHKSLNVQNNVKAYLNMLLNDLGYTGFRYDMVKGYSGVYTKMYNEYSKPQFSVGECWDGTPTIRNWIDATGKTSAAFDFQFKYVMRNATKTGNWLMLKQQNDGNWPLISTAYESGAYRRYAVTFVENHDTEVRPDGSSNGPLEKDTLAANAFLLAMPGTPCVFMKHWQAYKPEIKAMIEARKLAGINNESTYEEISANRNYYIVRVAGTKGQVICSVGTRASQYNPTAQGYTRVLQGHHYVYWMQNSMETAWADRASGDFSDAFDVTLTAVSAASGAQLVYTTDGTTPSATNGTRVASGSTLRISETTTLQVGLLTGTAVSGIVSRTFTHVEPVSDVTEVPPFCQVNTGEVCAFFEAPVTWGYTVKCWAWTDSPSDNFTGGNWPGADCELLGTAKNGKKVWKWTWNGQKQKNSDATQPAMIIFSNSGSPQTDNLTFHNGGYYTKDGFFQQVTGIQTVRTDQQPACRTYTLDGRQVETAAMRHGIYIVNGKKIIK